MPFSSVESFWIGQNDRDNEHVWKYINTYSDCSTSGVYLHWREHQSDGNTGQTGDQDCVAFYVDVTGFDDHICTETFYTICKTSTGKYVIFLPISLYNNNIVNFHISFFTLHCVAIDPK